MSSIVTRYQKYNAHTIFQDHPEFFSHFLIKQEEGESFTHFKKRYIHTCVEAGEYNWSCFKNPESAKAIFLLVGLRDRWFAREVFALCSYYTVAHFDTVLLLCKKVAGIIHVTQQARLRGSISGFRKTSRGVWNWMQDKPGIFPYRLELLRYQLLHGKTYEGPSAPLNQLPRRLLEIQESNYLVF